MATWALMFITLVASTIEGGRVVCYFTSWAQYRGGRAKFLPENIDSRLCTHIIYLFANVRRDATIATFDHNDESKPGREGLFARVVKLKKSNPHLKVLLSIGGATADYAAFGDIVNTFDKRVRFEKNVVSYLRKRGFDGMELSWFQPTAVHRIQRVLLITALRYAFDAEAKASGNPRLLLTLGMPAGKRRIDEGYEGYDGYLRHLSNYVDFFNLLTYNFYGSWNVFSGFNSPLYTSPNDHGDRMEYTVDWVATYYLFRGVPREMINIGIPTFAITFTLNNSNFWYVGSRVNGTGKPGKYTARPGYLAYYEVCDFIASGARVVHSLNQMASYAVKGDQWVSFESPESATAKACYILRYRFGGANVWSLDYDDFNGNSLSCGQGVNPLMTTISKIVPNNDQDIRCTRNIVFYSEGGSDGTILGKKVLNAHLLLPWLLIIVCVV